MFLFESAYSVKYARRQKHVYALAKNVIQATCNLHKNKIDFHIATGTPQDEIEVIIKNKKIEHFLSLSISLNISAALAVSLEAKDILLIDSIIFLESNDVISICSTGLSRKLFLL